MRAQRKSPIILPLLVIISALDTPWNSRSFAQEGTNATRIELPLNSKGLFHRDRSTTSDEKQKHTSTVGPEATLTADQLEAGEAAGLPVPKQNKSASYETAIYRTRVTAEVRAPLQAVLEFYNRELGKRSEWKMRDETRDTTGSARIKYVTADGPAVLALTETSGTTSIELVVRKEKEAQASGLMPKPGQVRILIPYTDAQLSLATNTINVKAGQETDVRLPALEVKPGTYIASADVPGVTVRSETISVGADEIWGLVISPIGVVMPLQMY